MTTPTRRWARTDATQLRILDAATDVFSARGFSAATMADIVEHSGASIGSIYHHFGGKEQLAAALYVDGLRDYQERFLRVLRGGEDAEATVRAIVANHLHWVADNPRLAAYLLSSREAEVSRATDHELRGMNRAVIEATREWIAEEVGAGQLRPLRTQLFYAVLIGPCQEFARQWVRRREREALEEAVAELGEAAWRAVRA
jgi:AcrR family transcriptional regulator